MRRSQSSPKDRRRAGAGSGGRLTSFKRRNPVFNLGSATSAIREKTAITTSNPAVFVVDPGIFHAEFGGVCSKRRGRHKGVNKMSFFIGENLSKSF
jgi:hypothetical protein